MSNYDKLAWYYLGALCLLGVALLVRNCFF